MNKEKLYQTNLYNFLSALEERINWEEKVFKDIVATSPNSYANGYHSATLNTLNNTYCVIKDLQQKTFNGKEFTKDEIENLLNEKP